MTQKLQLVEQPSEPERCAAENLTPGQFLAAGELTTGRPTEVLFTDTFPQDGGGRETLIVHRPLGVDYSIATTVGGNHWFTLAGDRDLAEWRAGLERAQAIEALRSFTDWLEQHPRVPLTVFSGEPSESLEYDLVAWSASPRPADPEPPVVHPSWPTEAELKPWESLAPVADRAAESMEPITQADVDAAKFAGGWTSAAAQAYEDDDNGFGYSRADDGDDPTPVSGARVPMHNGGMTEQGLVDETLDNGCPEHGYRVTAGCSQCSQPAGQHHTVEPCR